MKNVSRRKVTAAVVATVLMTGACGSDAGSDEAATTTTPKATAPVDNGVAAKSPQEILAAAKNALASATSAHVKGKMNDGGGTISMNLRLGRAGGKGTLKAPIGRASHTIALISVDGKFYVKSPGLWRAVGGAAAANLIGARWVVVPPKNAKDFAEFEQMIDLKKFADEVLKPEGKTITKGEPTVIDGKPAIALIDGKDDSKLYIATTGTPYPLKIEPAKPAKDGEGIDFLDYNAPYTVTAPTDVLDLSEIQQT
ncbi:lipoprotein [Actinomadura alba]